MISLLHAPVQNMGFDLSLPILDFGFITGIFLKWRVSPIMAYKVEFIWFSEVPGALVSCQSPNI